jgi:hypothetical protein
MEDSTSKAPSPQNLYLSDFQKNNPQCKFSFDEDKFVIEKAWAVDNVRFVFDPSEFDGLRDINNIAFLPKFDALFHVDRNEAEFFFAYLKPDEEPDISYLDRNFAFNFMGQTLECCFKEPSQRLFSLAKRIRLLPSFGTQVATQLRAFRDVQRLDQLPEQAKDYFDKRVPRSFFVKTEKPILDNDWEQLSRHINFHMQYYDRETPLINIRHDDLKNEQKTLSPRRYLSEPFPTAMAAHDIDDFILQLIEVACYISPRFSFIYYYQVIEYAGFYFVDEKAKKEIRRFLTDPAMVMCPEEKVCELLTVLSDLQHSDETKMRKVIDDYCDPKIIWQEVENDISFFSEQITFDGGFQLPALISKDTSLDTWKTMWMPKIFDQLTKIRNCLVHARERRQSQVIHPTPKNSQLIERYLPIIRRIAEQIALSKV